MDIVATSGQEQFDRLRFLHYPKTDLFLLCLNFQNPFPKESCQKWISEVRSFLKRSVPIILVLTKNDNDIEIPEDVLETLESIHPDIELVESCSALTGENIENIFNQAARICFKHRRTSFSKIRNFLT